MNPETRWQCEKCGFRSDLPFPNGHKRYGLPLCKGRMQKVPRNIILDGFPAESMSRAGRLDQGTAKSDFQYYNIGGMGN